MTNFSERLVLLVISAWYILDKISEMANKRNFSDEGRVKLSKEFFDSF
jgi:hypothetical protein